MKLPEYYPDIWFRIKLDIDFSDLDIVFRFMLRLFVLVIQLYDPFL